MNSARKARQEIRNGHHRGPTAALSPGHVQANLIVLPRALAFDFLLFANRNPKACPVVEIVEQGYEASRTAPRSDLRTDLPGYRLFVDGELTESASDATEWWRDDLVSFLLGCSYSFDHALARNGIPVRHLERACSVPMFVTDRSCEPAGDFSGPLVVSMRPIPEQLIADTVAITDGYGHAHGGPVHIGDPAALGIGDMSCPDFGDPVPINPHEVPVFWACGVTSQTAIAAARPELAITHRPGAMFITDLVDHR